jgi:hypothetical protein
MPDRSSLETSVPQPGPGQTWTIEAFRGASDADLEQIFADRAARDAGLRRLVVSPELQQVWTGLRGVVRLHLQLPSAAAAVHGPETEDHTVCLTADGVRLDDAGDPDVELTLPLVPAIRLLLGQADGALLHLAGVLLVRGDEDLLLALGSVLRAAGSERPVIDPGALDPAAVSAAIDGVPTAHLASVMAGGFRPLVLSEVFRRLPDFLIPEKAAGARVAVCFAVAGGPGGAVDRYVVRVHDGACTVVADPPVDERVDATLHLEGHELLRLVLGHLNPVRAVLSGQLRVEGRVIKALGFHSVMRIPSAQALAR